MRGTLPNEGECRPVSAPPRLGGDTAQRQRGSQRRRAPHLTGARQVRCRRRSARASSAAARAFSPSPSLGGSEGDWGSHSEAGDDGTDGADVEGAERHAVSRIASLALQIVVDDILDNDGHLRGSRRRRRAEEAARARAPSESSTRPSIGLLSGIAVRTGATTMAAAVGTRQARVRRPPQYRDCWSPSC